MSKHDEKKLGRNEIISLSTDIFKKIIAHSATFNEFHDSIKVIEASVNYAWAFVSEIDDAIHGYFDHLSKSEDLYFNDDDFDMVRSLSSQIYIESTIFHFQGMRECQIINLIVDSATDATLCAFTADYTLKRLEDHQKEALVKKKKENKRLNKYGKLRLVKNEKS